MEKIKAKILEINKLTSDVSEFIFSLEKKISFEVGQFIMIDIENGDEKIKKNAYSVVFYDEKTGKLVLLIKYTGGVGTTWLWTKKTGENISIYGGLGHFSVKGKKENLLFFATGIGLPPFVCMLNDLFSSAISEKTKVMLFFGLRKKEDIYYLDFLEKLKKENPNFSYEICLSREDGYDFHGYITEHPFLDSIDFKNAEVYYCGSRVVSKSLKEKVVSLGLDKKLFSSEAF